MKALANYFASNYNDLMNINDVEQLKQRILMMVKMSNINAIEARKVSMTIGELRELVKVQYYVTNAMLRSQGMGIHRR